MLTRLIEIFFFFIGLIFGVFLYFTFFGVKENLLIKKSFSSSKIFQSSNENILSIDKYNTSLADFLFDNVKIACLVLTQPINHETKAQYVKSTWGYKCNKLVFISTVQDDELGSIALPFNESREILWGKTRGAFAYAYKNYFDEVDWVLKCDDDSFFIMENVRYILYQYRPQTSIYIGHRYAVRGAPDGYMAGGGYILSKKAVHKFVTERMIDPVCRQHPGGSEDYEMGKCLEGHALALDAHDIFGQKQFFPIGPEAYMGPKSPEFPSWWYETNEWEDYERGGLKGCADTLACVHYASAKEMLLINYLVFKTFPFGLIQEYDQLPQKLSFDEIIKASESLSKSPNYFAHDPIHNFDEDEKF